MASKPDVPKTTPRLRRSQMAVEIEGLEVRLIVMCRDRYEAIKLHDDLIASCKAGRFNFSGDVINDH